MSSSQYHVQTSKNHALTFENENIKKINYEKTQECVYMRAELDKKNIECVYMRAELDKKNKECMYSSIELHNFRYETNTKYNNLLHRYNTLSCNYEKLSNKYTNRIFDTNHDEIEY